MQNVPEKKYPVFTLTVSDEINQKKNGEEGNIYDKSIALLCKTGDKIM